MSNDRIVSIWRIPEDRATAQLGTLRLIQGLPAPAYARLDVRLGDLGMSRQSRRLCRSRAASDNDGPESWPTESSKASGYAAILRDAVCASIARSRDALRLLRKW